VNWLFTPLRDEDVLVTGERVLYRQRRHWATVVSVCAQFAATFFLVLAFSMRSSTGLGFVLLVGTGFSVAVLVPLLRTHDWPMWQLIGFAVVAIWALQAGASLTRLGLILVLGMAIRAVVRTIKWAFYQRTYLTDRRIMEVDGFFGIRVDSMPLTKVTDVMLRRSPVGEVLGYGTFRVESAGQDQALSQLNYLQYPERFHAMVVSTPTWQTGG
jgi:hypothetical protein